MSSAGLTAVDAGGLEVEEGDTVATLNGQMSGKICEIQIEDGTGFLRVRPAHQSYAKGMWYAAEQVFRVAKAKKKTEAAKREPSRSRTKPPAKK